MQQLSTMSFQAVGGEKSTALNQPRAIVSTKVKIFDSGDLYGREEIKNVWKRLQRFLDMGGAAVQDRYISSVQGEFFRRLRRDRLLLDQNEIYLPVLRIHPHHLDPHLVPQAVSFLRAAPG